MSGNGIVDLDRARHLMMAALDGEISPEGRRELDEAIGRAPELRQEWESMKRITEVTRGLTLAAPPEEIWDSYWVSVYRRVERGLGWILVSVGTIVLAGYGAFKAVMALLRDTAMPIGLKLAVFAVAIGGIVLLLSVAREKWFTRRHDPYREIRR